MKNINKNLEILYKNNKNAAQNRINIMWTLFGKKNIFNVHLKTVVVQHEYYFRLEIKSDWSKNLVKHKLPSFS